MLEMFPEYWIEWFKLFYERTKNIKFEHYNNFRTTKAAVLVEPRDHPLLKYVIYNFMYLLAPQGWSLHVFCSNKNYQTINEIRKTMNLHIHLLPKDNLTEPEYNQLLTSENFYNEFDEKITHLLIFQTDTMLLKDNISDFLTFDFIGAAWSFSPHRGCNGGLSLRNRKKMLQMCKERICNENEDGFFSYTNQDMLNKIPTLEDKNNFSMETIWCDDPMGMHRAFGHQKHNEIKMKELLQRAWQRIFKTDKIFETDKIIINEQKPLTYKEVLVRVPELGYIIYDDIQKTVECHVPLFTIYKIRVDEFLKFIQEYIKSKPNCKSFRYFFTVYDGWREHSEPSDNPNFVNANDDNLRKCTEIYRNNVYGTFSQQYKEGKEAIIKALMYGKGNGKFGLLNTGEKSSTELTLKQRINEITENDKSSDWNSDLQLLAEYLKIDSEIGVAIQQAAVPNFKTLTYIVHDKARFTPAAEGVPDNTFTSQEVLGEATKIAIQKLKQ